MNYNAPVWKKRGMILGIDGEKIIDVTQVRSDRRFISSTPAKSSNLRLEFGQLNEAESSVIKIRDALF